MENQNSSSPDSNVRPEKPRKLALEFDLNETPPSPTEPLAAPGYHGLLCGSCGKPGLVPGGDDMVVCCGCGCGFHVKCLGAKEGLVEWKCFKCLLKLRSEKSPARGGGGLGLLDINAPPPQEVDEDGEGFLIGTGSGTGGNMQDIHGDAFVERTLNAPVTYANMRYVENGFEFQKASCSVTPFANHAFEVETQHRLNSDIKKDLGCIFNGKPQGSDCAPVKSLTHTQSQVYLQDLRENISSWGGILGEGWHVEFDFCQSRLKTFAVYCAPDGSRFDTKEKVAHYLGLLSNWKSSEVEEINKAGFLQKVIHANKRTKLRENKKLSWSRVSPGNEIINFQGSHDNNGKITIDLDPSANGCSAAEPFQDGFPVQFEDFFVISIGKIDPRSSFHSTCQIWPIGYRSIWHDRITGSLFVCEVLDGGNSGPIFRVHRLPCAKQSIPNASTVLWRPKVGPNDGRDKVLSDDDTSIQMMLTEYSPPHLDNDILSCSGASAAADHGLQKLSCLTTDSGLLPRSLGVASDNFARGDAIGEFSVDGRSPSSAWEKVSETLVGACHKLYNDTGAFRIGCKHNMDGGDLCSPEPFDSLSKFCYSANLVNEIPNFILSKKELDTSCDALLKWLRLDRFGLDSEFVQELIEQLPGVSSCSDYQSLNKRSHSSDLQTVGSGVLLAKRKNDLQVEKESGNLIQSCKKPSPSGKQLSSKLPPKLIGDVLQVCDFSWRFSEVLGLGAPFSLPELEHELINPWLDAQKPLTKSANEIQYIGNGSTCNGSGVNGLTSGPSSVSYTTFHGEDSSEVIALEVESMRDISRADLASNSHRRCTGAILANSHTLLLKVVIGELLSKVAAYVDPNFDTGESKSRRGRKKDVDNSVAAKKIKLDMLPINELTWPELARRYILAVLSMEGNFDSAEITYRESGKVFHCLRGDGGILCGSLTGVAAMEADAVLLAEASKKIFGSMRSKNDVFSIIPKESDSVSSSKAINVTDNEIPEWAQDLEPVRKLPTNVGARIRNCIYKALEKNPPEWAKLILKRSITKEVYRGNASGPTKRLVISVLAEVKPEDPKAKPEKKDKGRNVKTLSDIIMKQCRIMLRHAAAADEERVFCNLLGRTLLKPNDNDDEGLLGYPAMVSRPLDFRTIDLRLAAGAYSGSHEAFIEDVREVWHNIRTAYGERPELTDLVETLSQKFESLYEEEVLSLVHKVSESANPDSKSEESKNEVDDMLARSSESSLPKAPWEDGVCKVCGMDKDDDNVLLCDRCDSEYHTYCLDPPLARIPDGNWYCPSCAASQPMLQDGFCGTRLIRRGRKKRLQREFTQKIVETLAHLADMMELKEYWELTLEERVFLLKYLCDEALSSSIIRDHLDHCASVSADKQPKLRSLTSELKLLKSREDTLVANSVKSRQNTCCGELGSEALASMLSDDGKLLWQLPNGSSKNAPSFTASFEDSPNRNGPQNQFWSFTKCTSEKPCSSSCSQTQIESNGENGLSNTNLRQESNHGSSSGPLVSTTQATAEMSSMHENASQSYQLELKSVKDDITSLQESFAIQESESHKVAVRKELLGRDAAGRLYWAFGSPGTCQKVVVSGSWMVRHGTGNELVDHIEENLASYSSFPYGVQNHLDANEHSSWTCYESDAEVGELLGWLRDDDARERELKESIGQLRRNKSRDSNNAPNHLRSKVHWSSCDRGNALSSDFPVTKSRTVLEKMFASYLEQEATEFPKNQGSKAEVTYEGGLYRCDCLELLWPSRSHCASCHRTFGSSEDLKGHRNGKCKLASSVPKKFQENEGSSKGKRKIKEGLPHQKSLDGRKKCKKESKGEKPKNMSTSAKNQNVPDCPFNFEEIKAKFVTESSLKEVVNDIGLIGSGGNPSFVPQMSPYHSNPTLLLVSPTKKNKVNSCGASTVAENLQQQLQKGDNNPISNRRVDSGMNEPSKTERFKSKCTSTSSVRNKRSLLGIDKYRVICQSSLRPLVGKVTEILRQLKTILLDMDAALPEEALRPSRITSEKRCVWREFVKAAASIYEMIQATIVLEDMIRTEYLRNDWWYWSSPAAAAKVSTVSALALRIYTLDAAIIYENCLSSVNAAETSVPSSKTEKESSQNLNPKTNLKPSSPPLSVALDLEPAESSKPKSRQNKRRKDSGG